MHIPPRSQGSLKVQAGQSYVMREVWLPVHTFIHTEGLSSIALFIAAALALALANSPWSERFFALWQTKVTLDLGFYAISETLLHWINDGLMALFFFVVGLEIKRELLNGELSDPRRAALPVLAGIGGMILPALLYLGLNAGGLGERGWGIPMATDIAFALGALALLGRRVPLELRVFLLAFAIVDDLGAIGVIAVFYGHELSLSALGVALAVFAALILANRAGIRQTGVYVVLGILLWGAVFESGIHATVAGVLLAMTIPSRSYSTRKTYLESMQQLLQRFSRALEQKDNNLQEAILGQIEELSKGTETPMERLERRFHTWSNYIVLPLFALANAGLSLDAAGFLAAFSTPVTQGVLLGLVIGKPLGIVGACWLAVRLRLAALPSGVSWPHLWGVGMLGGIGFTVALFMTSLSFEDGAYVASAKVGILVASLGSALLGVLALSATRKAT